MRQLTLICLLASCMLCVEAADRQRVRTTRTNLKVETIDPVPDDQSLCDTITIANDGLNITGYEKTLRSRKESMLVTNVNTPAFSQLVITIEYLDEDGHQLHKRQATLRFEQPVPPGQTRMASIPSWDSQFVWHYYLSEPPSRTRSQATPYWVRITPLYAFLE